MNIKELRKRLWKSWTWRQRLSYLWERYNYFSDHAKEMRQLKKELNKIQEKHDNRSISHH